MAKVSEEVLRHLAELEPLKLKRRPRAKAYRAGPTPFDSSQHGTLKRVHFVRHGQGQHNVAFLNSATRCDCYDGNIPFEERNCPYVQPAVLDARLTELGEQQAVSLQAKAAATKSTLVLVSPLQRTLQTATLAFASISPPPLLLAYEELREQIGTHICDKRRNRSVAAAQFPHVDFSLIEETDTRWTIERESKAGIADRAELFLAFLFARPEENLTVVGHSAFLLTLFQVCLDCSVDPSLAGWFETGEMRSVDLQPN